MVTAREQVEDLATFQADLLARLRSEPRFRFAVDRDLNTGIQEGLESTIREVLTEFTFFTTEVITSQRVEVPPFGEVGIDMMIEGSYQLAGSEVIPIRIAGMVRRIERITVDGR